MEEKKELTTQDKINEVFALQKQFNKAAVYQMSGSEIQVGLNRIDQYLQEIFNEVSGMKKEIEEYKLTQQKEMPMKK